MVCHRKSNFCDNFWGLVSVLGIIFKFSVWVPCEWSISVHTNWCIENGHKQTLKGQQSVMSNVSAHIRRIWHVVYEEGARQGRARMLVESILQSAILMKLLLKWCPQIAWSICSECRKATDLYNCSNPAVFQFCTANSTCNNLDNPTWGASNTAFSCVNIRMEFKLLLVSANSEVVSSLEAQCKRS